MLKGYINKFNRGEVSADVLTRDDIARIRDCAALMQNFMPIRLGPMVYRPGTERIGPVALQAYHRILPFIASAADMAILEISQTNAASLETLRVWVDDELVVRTASTTVISNGTFTGSLTGWTDASTGTGATAWNAAGGADITGNSAGDWGILYQTVTTVVGEETALRIVVEGAPVSFGIGTAGVNTADVYFSVLRPGIHSLTFTPGVTSITFTLLNDKNYPTTVRSFTVEAAGTMEITMAMFPMTGVDPVIPSLQYEQSADVMFITSNGYSVAGTTTAPYVRVERRGRKSWSVVPVQLADGPFKSINTTFISLTPAAVTGVTTLTSNINFFFAGGSEGRLYKLDHAGTEGICRVLSVTSNTVVVVQVLQVFGGTTATFDWYEGRFAPSLPAPTAVTISAGRLWLGGADRVFGSVSDAYDSFDEFLVGDSAAITRSVGYGPVQRVNWLAEGDVLTAGLAIGEASIRSSALSEGLTPTNTNIKGLSSYGSDAIGPMVVDSVTYFVQRAGKKLIGLTGGSSAWQSAAFAGEDLTVLHPEICAAGIARIAVTREPETRIYVALNSGEMRVYLMDKSEGITAWSRIVLAGTAIVSDVLVLPEGGEDSVYLLVNRYLTPPVFGGTIIPSDEPSGVVGTLVGLEERLLIPPYGIITSASIYGNILYTYNQSGSMLEYTGGIGAARLNEAYPVASSIYIVMHQFTSDGTKIILPFNANTLTGCDTYQLPVPYSMRGAMPKVDLANTFYLNGSGRIQDGGNQAIRVNAADSVFSWPLSTAWAPETYGTLTSQSFSGLAADGVTSFKANYHYMNAGRTTMYTASGARDPIDNNFFPLFRLSFSTAGDLSSFNIAGLTKFYSSYSTMRATQLAGSLYTAVMDNYTVQTVSRDSGSVFDTYTPEQIGLVPSGMHIASGGQYMYLAGVGPATMRYIVRATLASPWVVTEPTWGNVVDMGTTITAIAFSSDGTRMFLRRGGSVYQYDMNIAYDIEGGFTQTGLLSGSTLFSDLKFSPDGTKMFHVGDAFNAIFFNTLSTAWDVTTAGSQVQTDVSAITTNPISIDFTDDGNKMFILGNGGTALYECSLGTPYTPSTLTYIGTNKSVVSGLGPEITQRKCVQFSESENKMFILGTRAGNYASEVFQFAAINSPSIADLATEASLWDPYYATQLYTKTQANNETLGAGLFIKPDGLHLYYWSEAAGTVADYTMTYGNQLNTAGTAASTAFATVSGQIYFDPDGLYMIAPVDTPGAGISRFTLTAPWTLAGSSITSTKLLTTPGKAFTMSTDGLHAYYFNTTDSTIRHLTLATAWDINGATETESFDPADAGYWPTPSPTGLWVHPDGDYLFVADAAIGVIRFTLATAYTLTGAVVSSRTATSFPIPYALAFDPDGKSLYTINSTIQQYGMRTTVTVVPNGQVATGITIEKMSMFSESKGASISKHYDSHVFYDFANPGTVLSGLDHLEAEIVYLWSEGGEYGPFTVSVGAIDTVTEYPYPIVGMRHDAEYLSNRLMDYVGANVMNEQKRVVDAGLILANAMLPAITFGADADHMLSIPVVDYDNLDQTVVQEYDGRLITFDGTYETDPRIRVVATGPCTIKALTYNVDQPYDMPSDPEAP